MYIYVVLLIYNTKRFHNFGAKFGIPGQQISSSKANSFVGCGQPSESGHKIRSTFGCSDLLLNIFYYSCFPKVDLVEVICFYDQILIRIPIALDF